MLRYRPFFFALAAEFDKNQEQRLSQTQSDEDRAYSKLAHVEKLDPFEAISQIDFMCKTYPAYTHDQVFELELGFVTNLIAYNLEKQAYQRRYDNIIRELKKVR